MSFDLAGLLQRNTQNTLSGLSSSASAGRTDMSGKTTEGAQTGSLTVGSAISGQVMKVEGDTVYVKLPSEVLTAKLQEGVNLQPGQSVTFAVSGISDKQITLQALFQNSAQTQVLGKALEQAGIAQTADSLSMVDAMMREGMSVDKNSLWQMYRQVLDYPQTTGENIVLMNRLQIPVNDLTAAQFQNLQNANGQLAQAANALTDSLYAEFADMAAQSPQEAASFMKELVLLLGESSQTEAGQAGALPLEGQEVPGDVQPPDGNQQPAAGNSTGQTEAAGDLVAGQPTGGQTAGNGVDARLAFDGQVQAESDGRQVQAEADNRQLQTSGLDKQGTEGQAALSKTAENSSQPGVDFLAELMKSDLFTKGDTRQLLRLFSSKEFRNLLTEQMKESIFGFAHNADNGAIDEDYFNLSLASHIIRLMGGEIGVNTTNGGTQLYFTIPFDLQEEEKHKPVKRKSNLQAGNFSGKRILIAEDSEMAQDALRAVLEVVGFEVDAAENGKKAVIQFISQPAFTYDAILMDVHMPYMDGREATRCIRISGKEDGETVPIIGLMANTYDEDVEESLKAGMQKHLSKPIDVDTLYKVLKKLIPVEEEI